MIYIMVKIKSVYVEYLKRWRIPARFIVLRKGAIQSIIHKTKQIFINIETAKP